MSKKNKTIIVPDTGKGVRFDLFLRTLFPEASRTSLQRMVESGAYLLNGKKVSPHLALKGGEEMSTQEIVDEKKEAEDVAILDAKKLVIPIVAKEKDFYVVEKPIGIAVHPGAGVRGVTVSDAMCAKHAELKKLGEEVRYGIVHRLDKDVSGLMIVARTKTGAAYFKHAFENRELYKQYTALVHGKIFDDSGTISLPIARSTRFARMAARAPGQEGKEAVTHWEVIERFANATLLRVTIETGRTHQIRAHLFGLGYPIVGDPLYKNSRLRIRPTPTRLMLHASLLRFTDPQGVAREYASPLPEMFTSYTAELSK